MVGCRGGNSWRLLVGLLRRQKTLNLERVSWHSVDRHGTEQKIGRRGCNL